MRKIIAWCRKRVGRLLLGGGATGIGLVAAISIINNAPPTVIQRMDNWQPVRLTPMPVHAGDTIIFYTTRNDSLWAADTVIAGFDCVATAKLTPNKE